MQEPTVYFFTVMLLSRALYQSLKIRINSASDQGLLAKRPDTSEVLLHPRALPSMRRHDQLAGALSSSSPQIFGFYECRQSYCPLISCPRTPRSFGLRKEKRQLMWNTYLVSPFIEPKHMKTTKTMTSMTILTNRWDVCCRTLRSSSV